MATSAVAPAIIVVSSLSIVATLFIFARHLLLLDEAKREREAVLKVDAASAHMEEFFVRANYIHLFKMLVICAASAVILLAETSGIPGIYQARLVIGPIALLIVALLSAALRTLEAKARGRTQAFYAASLEKKVE